MTACGRRWTSLLEHGYFVQDDFRIHPRLTLYLGVRYELITPFIERQDLLVNFDPDFRGANGKLGRFIVPTQQTIPNIDPRMVAYGVVTADEAGIGRGLIRTDKNNLAPRLGASWRVGENSVLRGGYGLFYPTSAAQGMRDPIATNAFNQGRTKTSPATARLAGWPGGVNPHGISPFNGGQPNVLGSQPSVNAVPFDLAQPRIQQYNVTFEHVLPWKLALRASYLGTSISGLIGGVRSQHAAAQQCTLRDNHWRWSHPLHSGRQLSVVSRGCCTAPVSRPR